MNTRRLKIQTFALTFFTLFIFYGMLLRPHYATDSYYSFYEFNHLENMALALGRPVLAIYVRIMRFMDWNCIQIQTITTLLSILMLSIIVYRLTVRFVKLFSIDDRLSLMAVLMANLLIVMNVYILEWFLFPEYVFPYIIGTFFTIESASLFFQLRVSITDYLKAVIFAFLGVATFQVNLMIFFPIAIAISMVFYELKIDRKSIKRVLTAISVGAFAGIIDIILQKIFICVYHLNWEEREATFTLKGFFDNFVAIIKEQPVIWLRGSNIIGPCMIAFLIISLIVLWKLMSEFPLQRKAYIVFVLLFSYASCFSFAVVSKFVWLSPRVIVSIFSFLFAVSIFNIFICHSFNHKKIMMIYSLVLFGFLGSNLFFGNQIVIDHYINNSLDQEYARQIYDRILNYENSSNIKVDTIVVGNDSQIMWKYPDVKIMSYNVNERSYLNTWSDVNLINFVSKRSFVRQDMTEEEYLKFEGANWDRFSPEEQIIFDGSKMYWIKY